MLYNHLQKHKGRGHMKMMVAENIRGATAMDGVDYAISQFGNEELTALWKSITEQEGLHE